jgi:hypothetical protein
MEKIIKWTIFIVLAVIVINLLGHIPVIGAIVQFAIVVALIIWGVTRWETIVRWVKKTFPGAGTPEE